MRQIGKLENFLIQLGSAQNDLLSKRKIVLDYNKTFPLVYLGQV